MSKIKVKIADRYGIDNANRWKKQFPTKDYTWKDCKFYFDDDDIDYDWYVTRNDIPKNKNKKENVFCPKDNTILFTSEPPSITKYGNKFCNQFGKVLTSHNEQSLQHPKAIRSQSCNIWLYEKCFNDIIKDESIKKSKLFSTICSSKQMSHTNHSLRYNFTKMINNKISEFNWFGKGVKLIDKKINAIDPYKFHLTIENDSLEHHWTEKIADAYLGLSVPIYYGCKNILDYFPEESLILIDINNFDKSLEIIKKAIYEKDGYEKRLSALIEARRRVLYEYNLPAVISNIISSSSIREKSDEKHVINSRRFMRTKHPKELYEFIKWKINNIF
tara:strand:+ start:1134 stop:2126 length:993 start_codon:yes stop_codon:yes gene_type:complete